MTTPVTMQLKPSQMLAGLKAPLLLTRTNANKQEDLEF